MITRRTITRLAAPAFLMGATWPAYADAGQIRIVRQPGMGHLPLILMAEMGTLDRHLKANGLSDVKVDWRQISGSSAVMDAIMSGSADLLSGSLTNMLVPWDKTGGKFQALSAITTQPMQLDVTNPATGTVADFKEGDKIGLPGVKTSYHAIILQMEAARIYGMEHFDRFDPLTVFISPPDGVTAMLSGHSYLTGHFTSAPFTYLERAGGKVHTILNSYDVMGGPHVFGIVWGATAFFEGNPGITKSLLSALKEVIDALRADPKEMAQLYIKADRLTLSQEFVETMLRDPQNIFELEPRNSMKFATFVNRTGLIKHKPASWKDYFARAVHGLDGS